MPNNTRQTRNVRSERLQVSLPPRLKTRVDDIAAKREITPSQVIREILERDFAQRSEGDYATAA